MAIDGAPLLGEDVHFARVDGLETDLRDALPGVSGTLGSRLAHRHVPLLGKHRLDDFASAGNARDHVADLLLAHEEAFSLEIRENRLAGREAVHADILRGGVFVDFRVLSQDGDAGEVVAATDLEVVEVVSRSDLHAAGSIFTVHVRVRDDRNVAVAEGKANPLPDEVLVAVVLRMHGNCRIAEESLGPGSRHDHVLRSVNAGVADFPEVAVFFLRLHLDIGHGGLELRVPIHQAVSLVDQTFVIQLHECLADNPGELFVHREIGALPVDRVAEPPHLLQDGSAGKLLPLEYFLHELFPREGMGIDSLLLELAFHHDLGRNARVVGAREPERVVARHAVVARKRVHDGLVEGVPHVENARDVGGRQLDGEARLVLVQASAEVAALFPLGVPVRLDRGGFKALCKLSHKGRSHFFEESLLRAKNGIAKNFLTFSSGEERRKLPRNGIKLAGAGGDWEVLPLQRKAYR